ncbi:MAG: tetratricopeptide repeat protein [Myxococcales bacterium]
MLEEGQLLGNEDVSSDGETWVPIGTIAAFAAAIQKLMESPTGMPGLSAGGAGPAAASDAATSAAESQQAALERMKALYGDRMAAIAVVDSAAADQNFKRRLPLIILAAVVAVVVGVGLYMGTTPYGMFGTSYLFPSHLQKGSQMYNKFQEAQKALNEDTFEGYNRALADARALLDQKRSAVESRALFAQAVFYLKRKYFAGDEHIKQAKAYLDELELSTKDDPEVIKARAGQHILLGEEGQIRAALESAITKDKSNDAELLHLLAETYLRERNTGPAAEALKRALAIDAKNPKALHMLGLVKTLEKNPDFQAALENYSKALDVDPRHLSSAVEVAAIKLQKQDDAEGAVDALRKALSDDAKKILAPSDLARAHYLQGMLYAARHQKEEALKEFEAALKIYPDSAPAKAAFGRFLLRRHDFVRATDLFEAAVKTDKKEIDYLDGYVRALLGAGKQVQANKAVSDAVGTFPGNPRISFLQGRVADDLEKGLEAESNYKRAHDADKTLWEPAYYLGRFYLARKRTDEAKKWFAEALARAPNNPETHVGEGSARLAGGELQAAKAQFLAALKLDPETGGGHFGLAQVLVQEGSLEDARKEFEAVLAIDPRVPRLYTEYGRLLWTLKELDGAAKALEKAKEADPRDALATWSLGAVLYDAGKLADSLKNLEAALTVEPIGDAYYYKARIHYDKRENNQAIDAIKAALERSSQNAMYHALRGHIMYQAGKFQEAVDSWQTAVKFKPDYADAIEALGHGYQEQGNWTLAIESFEKALTVDPKRTSLLVNIGDCLLNQNNDYDRTIKKYEEALRADPNQVGVYYKIGRCYDSKGKTEKAIQFYKLAIEKDPKATDAWRYLGYAYKEQNRKADACKAFQKYVEVAPDAGDRKEIENEVFDLGCKEAAAKPGKGKAGKGEEQPRDDKAEEGAAE